MKTLPPMELYEFSPSGSFTDFDALFEGAGSENREQLLPGELEFSDQVGSREQGAGREQEAGRRQIGSSCFFGELEFSDQVRGRKQGTGKGQEAGNR